ncbi:alpha/beta hydrolase [Streptomyces sp. CS090A]|uniref:alpha/beta hydrolase n=1 Tax=Streptomyces sp. CS090A TaxID=2162710 RepID=UPI000D523B60|nr:alpha/beta hydrolase [Streptomyces sp. CS090A]PVC80681.1 alpha/beta hydrolase [Streptomyces sp. CS090A]
MRRTLLILVAAVLAIVGTSAAAPATRAAPSLPVAVKAESATQQYGTHPRQSVNITWNKSPAPRPAVILITGGYWYTHASWATWEKQFADQGFQVFAMKYRLNFDEAWPAQRDDVASAVKWVRDNADRYDADPDNVLLVGSSAGGQMATDAATRGTNALGLKGIVALSPVASPYRAWQDGNTSTVDKIRKLRDNATLLARCYPDPADNSTTYRKTGCWDTWRDMESKNAVNKGDAPMLLVHSDSDFVPPVHSTGLETAAKAAGVPASDVSTRIVTGSAAHGPALLGTPGMFTTVVSWLKARTT